MYILHFHLLLDNSGPKIYPCGTPHVMFKITCMIDMKQIASDFYF